MLIGLVSAKGSPGATTAALCLAAAADEGSSLVLEADPAGGDVECWTGPHGEPGLVRLATALRPGLGTTELLSHAAPGVRVVTAPTTETAATAALSQVTDRLAGIVAGLDIDVFGDFGRWSPLQPTAARLAGADVVLAVCRPTLESIEHTRGLAASAGPVRVAGAVVVGGRRPYGPADISDALGVPVVGVLPWEPGAVLALLEHGPGHRWRRSGLAHASEDVVDAVHTLAVEVRAHV
jgi:hypothetical protein